MPATRSLDDNIPLRRVLLFVLVALGFTLVIYYVPNYSFLESMMAYQSSHFLNLIGVDADAVASEDGAFVGGYKIAQDCTGVQVITVFTGLLTPPIPKAGWKRKLLTLGTLYALLHTVNILRIVLEYWLAYNGISPRYLAHYPLSPILGVIGVVMPVLVTDRLMSKFGDFVCSKAEAVKRARRQG